MKRTTAFLATIIFCTIGSVYAMDSIGKGTWPKSWPQELDPLRQQSRTIMSGLVGATHHEIPFTKREDFESAWPHLLKVKSKGAPIILLRGPHEDFGETIKAGVRVWGAIQKENRDEPAVPIPGQPHVRSRWASTTFIELVIDGKIVDLNRIPLPADTPIIDERFKDAKNK